MHLILQGKCKSTKLLTNKEALENWLINIVAEIHMHVVAGPWVVEITDGMNTGLTGVIILAESHVSVHTFPEYQYAYIDVFSCFWFHADLVKRSILDSWGMEPDMQLEIDRRLEGVV